MKKLAEAQFGIGSRDQFVAVFDAFASPFPSLNGLDADNVLDAFEGDGPAWGWIAAALEDASCDGEWPADVYRSGEFRGGMWEEGDMFIVPYVRDRYMIIRKIDGWKALVICRYERPSSFAADGITRLAETRSVFLWNPLEWVEVEDDED